MRTIILDKESMSQKFQPSINISTNYTKCQLRTILKYLYQGQNFHHTGFMEDCRLQKKKVLLVQFQSKSQNFWCYKGGFHLVGLIITELKDHMICYKFECSNWWKIYFFKKKKPLQDLLSSLYAVISTNESTQFITGL